MRKSIAQGRGLGLSSAAVYRVAFLVGFFLVAGCTRESGDPGGDPGGGQDLASAPADLGGRDAAPPDLVDPGPPPTLSGIAPDHGDWGTQVTLTGTYLANTTDVQYGGHIADFKVMNATTVVATVPQGVGTQTFTLTTPAGSATSVQKFTIPTKVISFYPTTDVYATMPFSVYGYSLTGATSVKIDSVEAASFNVTGDEAIVVTIAPSTPSGNHHVSVTAPGGSSTSQGTFFLRCTSSTQCPGSTCGQFGVCN
jgi:hypothetical protein